MRSSSPRCCSSPARTRSWANRSARRSRIPSQSAPTIPRRPDRIEANLMSAAQRQCPLKLFEEQVDSCTWVGDSDGKGAGFSGVRGDGLVVGGGECCGGVVAVDFDADLVPPGLEGAFVSADVNAEALSGAFTGGLHAEVRAVAEGKGDAVVEVEGSVAG